MELKQDDLGGAFLEAPSALCGFPASIQGRSGLPVSPGTRLLSSVPGPASTAFFWTQVDELTFQARYVRADIEQPLTRRNLINLAHILPKQSKDFDLHLVETFNEVMHLTLYAHPDPMNPFKQLENPT